jgi:signal transduction histidine kinase
VWVGFGRGLARDRDGRWTFFTTNDGLPPGGVNDIHLDRAGRLWLASSMSGILRIDDSNAVRPLFHRYTTAQGLTSDVAEVLTEDARGRIYVGTGRGLDRLNPDTGRIQHFTTADGLAPGRFLAAFCDQKGTLWFGTTKGLSRFAPGRDQPVVPPRIVINNVSVAGSGRSVSALGESDVFVPDLRPDQNQLQFDFAALNFAVGQTLSYQYKLEGASTADWSAPYDQRTINYANLTPGKYKFSVRAVNWDGIASPKLATVTFTILPHIWQRWWFVSLIILAIALGAYAAYRYRIQRIVEVANVRASIAADLHDDIGANLTRIAILSEVARRQLGGDGEEGPISSIARISRESVASMSDIVWAINPDRDRLVDLVRRMRRHAEDVFASGNATLAFSASATDENLKLGAVLRRDLFLVYKEAINNAARHSASSRLEIELRMEGPWLLMRVADNGSGFDPAAESIGQGLASMQRRARKMGALLDIDSHRGLGTTVRLRVPCRPGRWPLVMINPT